MFFFMIDDSIENLITFSSFTIYLVIKGKLTDNKSVNFLEISSDCRKVLIKNIK